MHLNDFRRHKTAWYLKNIIIYTVIKFFFKPVTKRIFTKEYSVMHTTLTSVLSSEKAKFTLMFSEYLSIHPPHSSEADGTS